MATELGWGFRSIGRGLRRGIKGVAKGAVKGVVKGTTGVAKVAVKGAVGTVKLAANLALLPLRFLVKATVKLGRTLCNAPEPMLKLAATQAGVSPSFVPMFCKTIRENRVSLGAVRRLLPPALKISSKLAATGAFPPLVPILAVVKRIPFVSRLAGSELGSYASDLRSPKLRSAVDTMEIIALADHLDLLTDADAAALGLSDEDRAVMQSHLAASIASESAGARTWIPLVSAAAIVGAGVYLARRK